MSSLDHPSQPVANEFVQAGRSDIIPSWYRRFRSIARDHVASRNSPELALAPLPEDLGWEPNAEVLAAQQSEVDTFGLAEMAVYDTDDYDDYDDNWEDSDEGNGADSI